MENINLLTTDTASLRTCITNIGSIPPVETFAKSNFGDALEKPLADESVLHEPSTTPLSISSSSHIETFQNISKAPLSIEVSVFVSNRCY